LQGILGRELKSLILVKLFPEIKSRVIIFTIRTLWAKFLRDYVEATAIFSDK
jgi:hypothetical protein